MLAPLGLQLWSIRDTLEVDFKSGIQKIAKMGYAGVEPAGFPGITPGEAGKLFKEFGLVVPSIHEFPIPDKERKNQLLETLEAVDCKCIVSGADDDADFRTVARIQRVCDKFNEASELFASYGITIGVHNHCSEFLKVDHRYAYEIMLEYLVPEIFFQVDTYWVKVASVDPVEVVKRLGERAPLLHIKDGPGKENKPQLALGEGVMDIPAIVRAGSDTVKWLIVELDDCATDMLKAVEKSYQYMVSNNLAHGRL